MTSSAAWTNATVTSVDDLREAELGELSVSARKLEQVLGRLGVGARG